MWACCALCFSVQVEHRGSRIVLNKTSLTASYLSHSVRMWVIFVHGGCIQMTDSQPGHSWPFVSVQ